MLDEFESGRRHIPRHSGSRHFEFSDELILSHICAFRNVAIVLRLTFIFAHYDHARPPFWIFQRTDFIAYLCVSERCDRSETNFYFRPLRPRPAAILNSLTELILSHICAFRNAGDRSETELLFSSFTTTPGCHFEFSDAVNFIACLCVLERGDRSETNFHFSPITTTPGRHFEFFWQTYFIASLCVLETLAIHSETNFYFRPSRPRRTAILIFSTNWLDCIFVRFGMLRSFWYQLSFRPLWPCLGPFSILYGTDFITHLFTGFGTWW